MRIKSGILFENDWRKTGKSMKFEIENVEKKNSLFSLFSFKIALSRRNNLESMQSGGDRQA